MTKLENAAALLAIEKNTQPPHWQIYIGENVLANGFFFPRKKRTILDVNSGVVFHSQHKKPLVHFLTHKGRRGEKEPQPPPSSHTHKRKK